MTVQDPDKLRRLAFDAASEFWLTTRKPHLKERTFYNLESNVRALNKHFGRLRVKDIHIGHIREYRRQRIVNEGMRWNRPAGPSLINHEIVALEGVLRLAGEWDKIKPHYEPLPIPRPKKPKVMTDEEEALFFAVVATREEWKLAMWVSYITEMTSAAGSELRNLRLRDIALGTRLPSITIDSATAKNEFRWRTIILNQTAQKYLAYCLERAHSLGSREPDDYVFPLLDRKTRKYDPKRPCSPSWLRRAWDGIQEATGLYWLTPHCLRHQHATISLEAGEDPHSVAKRMGHHSVRMVEQRYGHLRQDSQKRAVDAIDPSVRLAPKKVLPFPNGIHLMQ
jgi:integrase